MCRAGLEHVRGSVDRLQLDLPWSQSGHWPEEVRAAASTFTSGAASYALSGWISPVDDSTWDDFVLVAPYVYDADVWSSDMVQLAAIADEGSSLVVRVASEELSSFTRAVAPGRTMPVRPGRR